MSFVGKGRPVKYYDIDGTILKQEFVNQGEAPTPPNTPEFDKEYLVFDKWLDLPEIVGEDYVYALAKYLIKDEATYVFVNVSKNLCPNLEIIFNITGDELSIDWGDGVVNNSVSHIYENYGEYVIKINGTFQMISGQNFLNLNKCILKCYFNSNCPSRYTSNFMSDAVNMKVLMLNENVIGGNDYSIRNLYSLKTIHFPKTADRFGYCQLYNSFSLVKICDEREDEGYNRDGFSEAYSLVSLEKTSDNTNDWAKYSNMKSLEQVIITNPNFQFDSISTFGSNKLKRVRLGEGVTKCISISSEALEELILPSTLITIGDVMNSKLKKIIIPSNVTSCGSFSKNYSLEYISLPSALSSMPSVSHCINLKRINIPRKITSFSLSHFTYCPNLQDVIIECETVPTLNTSSGYSYLSERIIFWVNDDIIEDLKVATNWSKYADKMRPLSEKPID
jgi:hypothetical protein